VFGRGSDARPRTAPEVPPAGRGGAGGPGALDHATVRVVNAVSEVKGRIVVGPPKSAAGRRTVAVPASVLAVLREHVASFSEAGAHGRVFVGVRGGTLRRTNFQPMWRRGVEAAGLPPGFRFHDLRHTGNTWAAGTGANLRELMERMGHSSTRAALIYLHAAKDSDRSIAAGIDRHLGVSPGDEDQREGVDRG
jgi:integrase